MSSTLAQFGFFAELRRLRQLLDAAKNHISELQENLDAKQEWIARLRNNLEAAAEDSTEMMRQRDLARQDAETAEAKLAEIEKYASGERLVPLFPESRNYESREEWTLEWIRRVALAQIDAPKHPDKSLPLAKDLTGSDPDFTGDLSTDEYIRGLRGSAPSDTGMEQRCLDFVKGAKWWEWTKSKPNATMWQSDQLAAYEAAKLLFSGSSEPWPPEHALAAGPSDTERLNKLEERLGFPGNCFINRDGKRIDHLLMSPSARGSSLHVTGSYSSLATLRDTADCFIKLSRERAKEDAAMHAETQKP
jgi:hypothetical protein